MSLRTQRGRPGVALGQQLVTRRFHPIHPGKGAVQVAEQIKKMIQDGRLAPGQRLPSVAQLAAAFGLSRPTVREGLQALAALGFLRVRQGVGTFVADHASTRDDPAYWLPWLHAHREDVLAVLEVREALEVKSAALAAAAVRRKAPGARERLQALEQTLTRMTAALVGPDLSGLEQADLEFHALVAELAGNPYLLRLSRSINQVFGDRRAVLALPGRAQRSVAQHREILRAIHEGDSERAGAAMGRHLQSTMGSVRALRVREARGRTLRGPVSPVAVARTRMTTSGERRRVTRWA